MAAKRGRGQPTKLTKEIVEAICSTLRAAGTVEDAALRAGIGDSTLYAWQAKGLRQKKGKYRDFLDAIKRAKADRLLALESSIRTHSTTQWQAAAWLLERTAPKRYAQRVRVHVEEELNDAIERLRNTFAEEPETLERVLASIAEGDRGGILERIEGDEADADNSEGR